MHSLKVWSYCPPSRLIFSEYDPYFALFNFWSSEVSVLGLVILAVVLVLSFFVERPWCKYACPYGSLLLGLSNLLRVIDISNPAHPTQVDSFDTPGTAYDVDVSGESVYLADGDGGLFIFRLPSRWQSHHLT